MNVTSIGEILFDIYPEHKMLGGAPLNFIYHIHKITGSGNIISRVGKDVLGTNVIAEFENHNLSHQFIQTDKTHPTGIARVEINEKGEPLFNIDTERAFDFIELTEEAENLINYDTDVLYFGTLAQRSEDSRKTIQALFNRGIKYFCDVNLRQNFYSEDILRDSIYTANILKVSYGELQIIHDLLLSGEYNTEKTSLELMEQFNIDLLAITRGKNGATLFENGKRNDFTPQISEITDTTGAGDAFSAVICLGFMQGWDLMQINKLANEFASQICTVNGAIPKNDRIYEDLIELVNGL